MTQLSRKNGILIAILLLSLVLIFMWGFEVYISILSQKANSNSSKEQHSMLAFEKIDKALSERPQKGVFEFVNRSGSPFNKFDVKGKDDRVGQLNTAPPPLKLVLKGTLMRDKALAIIEDESGKSYISNEGDVIDQWTIVKIQQDSVVIFNKLSSQKSVLKVNE